LATIHGLENPEQLVGRSLFEFIAPIALNHVKGLFTRTIERGITAEVVETQIVRADGESVFIEVKSVPILVDGRVTGLRGILRDVTERKRSELALRETYDLLKAVIDASAAGITILDREGNVRLWSPAAERMFGWRKEEVLERPLPTVPSDGCDEYRALRERAMAGELIVGLEVVRQKKDGSPIDVSLSTAPLRDGKEGITGIVGIMVDITGASGPRDRSAFRPPRWKRRPMASSLLIAMGRSGGRTPPSCG
jgi:PAS domain S-box-containing protein